MGKLDHIYSRLPVWAQHGAVTAFGMYWSWLRFGPGFGRFLELYRQRDRWTARQWSEWQSQELAALLIECAKSVPHYSTTWTPSEKRAARAGRLDELPLLGKEPLRSNPRAFVRTNLRAHPELTFYTSGSTGTPIASIWTVQECRRALAVREARSAGWAGVSFRLPRGTFSGRMVEPNPDSAGPFHRFNLAERQVYLSAFHLRRDTALQYVRALKTHSIQWITGYAVSSYLLAKFILEERLPMDELKAVVTTSEKLTPGMREVMEAAFGCRVYEEYSTVENALFASECEFGRLHISPDVAVVEILRPDGTPCAPGETGEIVATCLLRDYQPLIRYRLGDLGQWDACPCPCGRQMPVLKEVVGRLEDIVVGPDGRQMVRFHGIFINQPRVQEGQIIQETRDRIRVKVVPAGSFGPGDELEIVNRVRQRLGAEVGVIVETVPEIPRTRAGKFRAVISMVRDNEASHVTA